jgi:Domain of unknown function (DUF4272)
MARPNTQQVADRALILYALVRRGYIEHVIASSDGDPLRIRQGEAARLESDRWLDRERLVDALVDEERRLLDAPSGSWPVAATTDALWRKEALGALLWALQHLAAMPAYGAEFEQQMVDDAITRYGSVAAFRAEGVLRDEEELERAWMEADAWYGATEGREGDDAGIASIASERYRAFSWLRDADARPA